MALKFKAGYRRVNNMGHPSTYQMNYRWKDHNPNANGPLIEAASEGGQQQKHLKVVVPTEHTHQPPEVCERERVAPTSGEGNHARTTVAGPKVNARQRTKVARQRRTPVEPLVLPDSDSKDEHDGESKMPTEPLRTRDTAGTKVLNRVTSGSSMRKQTRKDGSPARVGVKKKRKFVSPLKRLYEKDYQRRGLTKALFQTQYQMQYKDWLQETGRAAGREGKKRMKQGMKGEQSGGPRMA